ncbi:MAG: retropepsin-like aspartic protease [Methylovulum sp.]|nr:retropepsin-like aspartic protease [Methylovulum sp.]
MQKMMPLLLVTVALSLNARGEGMIYKCKNPQDETVYKKSPCADAGQTVIAWEEPRRGQLKTSIRQAKTGHYYVEGAVNNGTTFTFVIDTGASRVALPQSVATAAKLDCKAHSPAHTANGLVNACYAVAPTLKFGPFQLENVAVMVLPNLGQALLGMNVLEKFNIEQDHGEMRISER